MQKRGKVILAQNFIDLPVVSSLKTFLTCHFPLKHLFIFKIQNLKYIPIAHTKSEMSACGVTK